MPTPVPSPPQRARRARGTAAARPLPGRVAALAALVSLLGPGCDQNMSDTPLPEAAPQDLSRIAARLSQAPGLSVPAGATISGLIELPERLAPLTAAGDVLFVIARVPGSDGPPLAVERLTGNAYPMPFVLDASSAMQAGGTLDRPIQLIVKVDKDGDAGTASAEDLLGFTPEPVRPGDAGVRIALSATMGEISAQVEAERGGAGQAGGVAQAGISGWIDLPPRLVSRTAPGDVVFVIARDPSAPGPPVAVARLEGNRYPMAFKLDDQSRMLGGGAWPARLSVEARVDKDGDPLTREPGGLWGGAPAPVAPGDDRVRIELGG